LHVHPDPQSDEHLPERKRHRENQVLLRRAADNQAEGDAAQCAGHGRAYQDATREAWFAGETGCGGDSKRTHYTGYKCIDVWNHVIPRRRETDSESHIPRDAVEQYGPENPRARMHEAQAAGNAKGEPGKELKNELISIAGLPDEIVNLISEEPGPEKQHAEDEGLEGAAHASILHV